MNNFSSTSSHNTHGTASTLLIYGFMILFIVLLFWHFTQQNYKRILQQNIVYAEDVAMQTAQRVDDQFKNAMEMIKAYAYFLQYNGIPQVLYPSVLKNLEAASPFDGLRFTNADGIALASGAGGASMADRAFFKRGMAGESGLSVILYSRIYHQPVITFFTPIKVNGEIRGVLHGSYLAEKYLPHLLETTFFGKNAEVFLCTRSGWVIASASGKMPSGMIASTLLEAGELTQTGAQELQKAFTQKTSQTLPQACSPDASISVAPIPHQPYYLVQAVPSSITSHMASEANQSGVELEICLLLLFGMHAGYLLWQSHSQKKRLLRDGKEKAQVVTAINSLFTQHYALCNLVDGTYQYIAGSKPSVPSQPVTGTYDQLLTYLTNLLIKQSDKENFENYFQLDHIRKHLRNTDFAVYECQVSRKGKAEWENLNAICIERDNDGTPLKMLFMRQNMTEKKTRELGLEKKLSIKDRQERQYRLATTASAYFSYEFNVTRDLIESDITVSENGSPASLLMKFNLEPPCKATDFYRAFMETLQKDSAEDFSVLLSMDYLCEYYNGGKKELDLEVWQSRTEGEEKCLRISFYLTRDGRTNDLMALVVARDITAQVMRQRRQTRALEDALRQARHANDAKTTFLSNMSHDIRTPMNAIIGFSSIAISHLDNREQVRDCLAKVLSSSNHLLSLINDILDMSRIESGKMQLKEQECNISELMHNILNIIQPQVKAKQLQLFIDTYEVTNEDVVTDPLKVNQIFINLLGNAVKYTPAGGIVSFRIRQTPAFRHEYADYIFEVRDTGIGMSAEFVEHIFEPFTRESTTTQSGIQGTGLGMAIAKTIIDMMNGKIEVESEPGKGSVFTVTLTLKLFDRKENDKSLEKLRGIRVLVVDDDYHVCNSVDKMLQEIGLRSEWTTSGIEAVQKAKIAQEENDPFNTFILDWQMPEQNGLETARQIRAIAGADTPIIILTAYDWAEIEEDAKSAGITAFCAKPLFMSDLRNALLSSHKLLENRGSGNEEKLDFAQRRILLVDDVEMNREVAEFILTESGFLVEMAPDGTDAVEMVQNSPEGYYDAILMDVQMPIMNGYEATRAIRNMNRKDVKEMPIIAMTANALEEDRAAALKYGMNAHVAKPIDIKKFFEVMKDFFNIDDPQNKQTSNDA